MNRTWMLGAAVAIGTVLGCVGPNGIQYTGAGASGTGGSGSGASGTGTGAAGNSGTAGEGLPCDVASVLSTHCTSCHNDPPTGGAPYGLVTYADVTKPGIAAACLAAMKAQTMPPGGGVSAAEIATFESWVNAGTPMGSCGGDAGPPDTTFDGPSTCVSNVVLPTTYQESSSMNPGEACVQCHQSGEGPGWTLGGTVFALGHVPDGCQPTAAQAADLTQAKVVITDANGVEHTLSVNSVGNFHASSYIPTPYSAKVTFQGKERAMGSKQTNGDCNICHTDAGAQGAPGRVALPQ